MKITVTKREVFDFDYDEEITRLKECFEGEQLQRQLDIINTALIDKDFDTCEYMIVKLPYCENACCPEQEFVGEWQNIIYGGVSNHYKRWVIDDEIQIDISEK